MANNSPPKDDRPFSCLLPSSFNLSLDRPTPYFSPNSANRLYLPDQAIQSGYHVPVGSREAEFRRYPNDLRDPVDREREKNRIRAEIMTQYMERRRILEEEVRKELMIEREKNLKIWESSRMQPDDFRQNVHQQYAPESRDFVHEPSRPRFDTGPEIRQSIYEPARSRFDASINTLQYLSEPLRTSQPLDHLEERRLPLLPIEPSLPVAGVGILGSVKNHLMLSATSSLSLHQTNPLPPATSNLLFHGIKPLQVPGKERILLANSNTRISDPDRKRKASALGADHHRAGDLDKKPKGQWSCKLCNVTTTSEKTLNAHLAGKKHKMKEEEEALTLHKKGSNSNPAKDEITSHKPEPTKRQTDAIVIDTTQKSKVNETSRPEAATMVDQKNKTKTDEPAKAQGLSKTPGNKGSVKKFKFWCDLCQIGVNSELVMAGHQKGKLHMRNLEDEKKKRNK